MYVALCNTCSTPDMVLSRRRLSCVARITANISFEFAL